jgi:GNAT superfamily N-acetyltransferase
VSEVTVRPAQPGDGEAIAPLSRDSAAYYRELAPDDFRYPELDQRRLFINALLTARSHWRRGVGSALVAAAEAWGRDRGASVAVMDTYADSPVSVPFWHGRGYRTRGVIMHKRLD